MGFLKRLRKLFADIIKVVVFVILAFAALVLLVAIAVGLAALLSVLFPALVATVSTIGTFVFGKVKDFISVFKPVIQSLRDLYNTWVKPTLTWVNDKVTALDIAINTIYTLTVGGVTAVYNNLFGWVDGIQTKFNEIVDKTVALVAVVDQKAANKINALRDEINTTIDKYSSDLFDKVLLKINEVAGPILTRVGEITAVFTERFDALRGVTDRIDEQLDTFLETPTVLSDDAVVDTTDSKKGIMQQSLIGDPNIYETEYKRTFIVDSVMDKWFDEVLRIMKREKPSKYDMIMDGIDRTIAIMAGKPLSWDYEFDEEVGAFQGDITAGDLDYLSNYAELWGAYDEIQPEWKVYLERLVEFRAWKRRALRRFDKDHKHLQRAYFDGAITLKRVRERLVELGYKKRQIDHIIDVIEYRKPPPGLRLD